MREPTEHRAPATEGRGAAPQSGVLGRAVQADAELGQRGLRGRREYLAWNPDIVLLGNFDETMPQHIYQNKVWQSVSAVKSRRVYKIPLGGIALSSPRVAARPADCPSAVMRAAVYGPSTAVRQ